MNKFYYSNKLRGFKIKGVYLIAQRLTSKVESLYSKVLAFISLIFGGYILG